jgi:hypothetical protein
VIKTIAIEGQSSPATESPELQRARANVREVAKRWIDTFHAGHAEVRQAENAMHALLPDEPCVTMIAADVVCAAPNWDHIGGVCEQCIPLGLRYARHEYLAGVWCPSCANVDGKVERCPTCDGEGLLAVSVGRDD